MRKPPSWNDREDYVFTIERGCACLSVIADACGNGEYTDTARVEEAITLVADSISDAAEDLRVALWPQDDPTREVSPAFLEYRRCFDAWVGALDEGVNASVEDDALRDALDAVLSEPVLTWANVAQLGIVAHDYAWNRHATSYRARDCPEQILQALIVGIRELAVRDFGLAARNNLLPTRREAEPPAETPPSFNVQN